MHGSGSPANRSRRWPEFIDRRSPVFSAAGPRPSVRFMVRPEHSPPSAAVRYAALLTSQNKGIPFSTPLIALECAVG
jgi:hypothetical protein